MNSKRQSILTSFLFGFIALAGLPASAQRAPAFDKVFIVVLENTGSARAHAMPYLSQLAKRGADLRNMSAETHPSQGNYIALTSGSLNGVRNDENYDLDVAHIGDLLEAKGLSWKVYAESFPGHCFQGKSSGTYARKHVPFISYIGVQSDPARCDRIVDASALDRDIKNGALPAYSLFIPDQNNDGHNTGVAYADRYLQRRLEPLLNDPAFMNRMLVIVTFDESAGGPTNDIYTTLIGDSVQPGSSSLAPLNHYSLLRTIEDAWGLGSLGREDARAQSITGVWK